MLLAAAGQPHFDARPPQCDQSGRTTVTGVISDHEQSGRIRSKAATRPVLPTASRFAASHAAASHPAAAGSAGGDLVDDLFRAHAVTMVRVAMLLLGDQSSAEDVVQDAFFGLYRSLPKLRDRSKALPYLRASVINGSRSVLRARKRAVRQGVHHEPPVWSAESAAMAGEDRKALLAAVARLPRRAREVLALRYYLDLADHEIAAALGVSRATVSSTASRALAALGRELKEEL
jgi:RNA polymerase sigma-70 factor (sigma-E family)